LAIDHWPFQIVNVLPICSAVSSILIAENDRDARGLVAGWLGDAGYVCATADTADALQQARQHPPAAALVTVTSVDDGGMWVLRTLKGEDAPVATVALTPNPDLAIAGTARRLGAFECLPWPSSRATVLDSVQRALEWRSTAAAALQRQKRLLQEIAYGRDRLAASVRGLDPDAAHAVLIASMEARAADVYDHAQRVAHSAAALAAALRLQPDVVRTVRTAALLHDVGKLAVPGSLLRAAGPLSDEEIAVLRMHVAVGEEVLELVPTLAPAAPLVATSHERYDGGGYPAGLAGDAIPLGARIIAVADAYDALVSQRSYTDPVTHDEANAELVRCAGTQFDPDVVRAWIELGDRARC
jgi:putative nucleotidyltransferase with HDIG domain